jgi:hypothetical protein
MTITRSGSDRTRTPVLGLPVRTPSTESPYWHRRSPLLAVMHSDPGYTALRGLFPAGWAHLARVAACVDATAALESPRLADGVGAQPPDVSRLLHEAAAELLAFAAAEQNCPAAADAEVAADRLAHYAETLEWKPVRLTEPDANQAWLYCGPLSTWAMHRSRSQLAFLVAWPNPAMQREVDVVDARLPELRGVVSQTLQGAVKSVQSVKPTMWIMDLLLAAGDPRTGHKNFAHFFPLEGLDSFVEGAEFTVVLGNVYASRLEQCSLRLLDQVRQRWPVRQSAPPLREPDDITRSVLRWFRCHDLAHFWRIATVSGCGTAAPGLADFERMVLDEAHADVLGLLCAKTVCDSSSLEQAFHAEMLRYLSRRCDHFADSAAAALEAGWLIEYGLAIAEASSHWLTEATPALRELVGCLHRALWQADPADLGKLRAALITGLSYQDKLGELFCMIPTDVDFTFG